MHPEDDLLPLSALQHLLFCARQCALIHVERVWAENRWTVEGGQMHRKAHEAPDEWRGRVRIVRGLELRSLRLGLVGKADVVEFEPVGGDDSGQSAVGSGQRRRAWTGEGVVGESEGLYPLTPNPSPVREEGRKEKPGAGALFGEVRDWPGAWRVTPVEYKRGRPKKHDADRVQVCAQAMCLEEMLGVRIDVGMLFYSRRRRRTEVALEAGLRATTESAARQLHELIATGRTPPARREAKCKTCSLADVCMPGIASGRSAARFVDRQLTGHLASQAPESDLFDAEEGTT